MRKCSPWSLIISPHSFFLFLSFSLIQLYPSKNMELLLVLSSSHPFLPLLKEKKILRERKRDRRKRVNSEKERLNDNDVQMSGWSFYWLLPDLMVMLLLFPFSQFFLFLVAEGENRKQEEDTTFSQKEGRRAYRGERQRQRERERRRGPEGCLKGKRHCRGKQFFSVFFFLLPFLSFSFFSFPSFLSYFFLSSLIKTFHIIIYHLTRKLCSQILIRSNISCLFTHKNSLFLPSCFFKRRKERKIKRKKMERQRVESISGLCKHELY